MFWMLIAALTALAGLIAALGYWPIALIPPA
jgi:hypothetical protein